MKFTASLLDLLSFNNSNACIMWEHMYHVGTPLESLFDSITKEILKMKESV